MVVFIIKIVGNYKELGSDIAVGYLWSQESVLR